MVSHAVLGNLCFAHSCSGASENQARNFSAPNIELWKSTQKRFSLNSQNQSHFSIQLKCSACQCYLLRKPQERAGAFSPLVVTVVPMLYCLYLMYNTQQRVQYLTIKLKKNQASPDLNTYADQMQFRAVVANQSTNLFNVGVNRFSIGVSSV